MSHAELPIYCVVDSSMTMKHLWEREQFVLTASVKPFDTGDVIGTHVLGISKYEVGIGLGNDGWLSITGEGGALGGQTNTEFLRQNCTSLHKNIWDNVRML